MTDTAAKTEAARITIDEAWRRYQSGEAVFVDVRGPEAYEQGHIPGALSLPLAELGERNQELPRDRALVFYCT